MTTTTLCYFESPTPDYPRGRIIWEGVLGPDFDAHNGDQAKNELYITFRVTVPKSLKSVKNTATIDIDLNGDGEYDETEIEVANSSKKWTRKKGI